MIQLTLPALLAYAVILIGLPINWLVTLRLYLLYRRSGDSTAWNRTVQERGITAAAVALVVTLFAAVFINNSLFDPPIIDAFFTQIITRVAILMLALPALYWLYLYRKD